MLMPFRVGEKKVDVISCHGTNFLSGETGWELYSKSDLFIPSLIFNVVSFWICWDVCLTLILDCLFTGGPRLLLLIAAVAKNLLCFRTISLEVVLGLFCSIKVCCMYDVPSTNVLL
jgi:hypothetical protein